MSILQAIRLVRMKPFTILVAEDDLLCRMVLERSVVQWGYQLVSAADGGSALELLRTARSIFAS